MKRSFKPKCSANCSMGTWVMLPVAVMPTTYLLGFFFAISINSLMFFHGAFLAVIRTTGWLTDVPMKSNASVP